MTIIYKYGDYTFSPKPLLNISTQPLRTNDGSGYGEQHTITLEGALLVSANPVSGVTGVFKEIDRLRQALSQDGQAFIINCQSNGVDHFLVSGYPIIQNVNIQKRSDNYTQGADYTIEMIMPTLTGGSILDSFNGTATGVESCSESWDIEFQDEKLPFDWTVGGTTEKFGYKLAVTHTIDVKGRPYYSGGSFIAPWQSAKQYAEQRLGFNGEMVTLTGILGLPGTNYFSTYDVFNQYRRVGVNKSDGSVNVVETFIVTPSGQDSLPNNAIETFEVSVSQNDGSHTVSINGEIEGLAKIVYNGGPTSESFSVSSGKFAAASGYFKQIQSRLYDRAKAVYDAFSGNGAIALSPGIKSKTIGVNPIQGTISYDYQYETQAGGWITGENILSKSITIDDQLQNDLFASHTVIGKASGPILQDLNTKTARTRTVNIELVTYPPKRTDTVAHIYSGVPTGQVESFIGLITGDIGSGYSQMFITSNTQNWNFTLGRYTRSIAITYGDC